jgi:hypothetical protein
MQDIKTIKIFNIDDYVKMNGGKCKGCEGVIVAVMRQFCSVRLTKDKKGTALFSVKPNKVKRDHIEVIPATAVEMPTQDNLKVVDDLEPSANLLNDIDNKLIEESKTQNVTTLIEEVTNEETGESNPNFVYEEPPKKNATLIDEHGCKSDLPTIDDALNLRDENQKLKLQIEALVGWQSHASAECAKYRKEYDDIKNQLMIKTKECEDAVNYYQHEKLEKIRDILNL